MIALRSYVVHLQNKDKAQLSASHASRTPNHFLI